MRYVGLDVHTNRSSLCILDDNGKVVNRLEVRGGWNAMLEAVEKIPRPFAITYEASCGYGYLHERLCRRAERVAVSHPGQLRLIFKSKRKNDRVDAEKQAKLLYLDQVPQVHVPGGDVRQWRGLIEFRQRLLSKRVRAKNQLRALLRSLNLKPPGSAWTKKGRAWLSAQEMGPLDAVRRDVLLEELIELEAKIKRVTRELDCLGKDHPGVTLLRTIPGIGPRTAEALCAYIDDIKRFARNSQLGAYFGMVPCQDASAEKNRLGHITRDGPATVRKLLSEAAWQGVRRSPTIRAFFQRVTHDDPDRRKIALVATAHYLLRVCGAMLRSGESWRESVGIHEGRPWAGG
jgi:transposase